MMMVYGDQDQVVSIENPELFELMKKHLPECEIVKDYDMVGDPDVTFTFKRA